MAASLRALVAAALCACARAGGPYVDAHVEASTEPFDAERAEMERVSARHDGLYDLSLLPSHAGNMHGAEGDPALLEYYNSDHDIRAAYGNRRRMVPYGGFSHSDNPFRRPNSLWSAGGMDFFTPKWSAGPGEGPAAAAAGVASVLGRPPSDRGAVYGTDSPYSGPFTYYTPPPSPLTSSPPPAAAKAE